MKRAILYEVAERTGYRFLLGHLYRVEVRGAERIPREGAVILAANHESMLDPWLLPLATRRPVRYMAKAELWRYAPVRWVMEKFGTFPVERGTGDRVAVGRAAQLLAEGELLGIFPQGTCLPFRNRRWHRGAAKLALATGATIVPVCLVGTERALRPGKFKLGFPRVLVLVGEPIEVERAKPNLNGAKMLTDRIEAAVEELREPYGPPAHAWYPPPSRSSSQGA
jgi:1-acyl-sn-glycerol-3-phosphate acyltransferase